MKKLFYVLAFILIAISVFFTVSAHALTIPAVNGKCQTGWTLNSSGSCTSNHTGNGAGGSWGDDSGFGGNGGSTGGSGAGGSWVGGQCNLGNQYFGTLSSVCSSKAKDFPTSVSSITKDPYSNGSFTCNFSNGLSTGVQCNVDAEPLECPEGTYDAGGGVCLTELKCPAGYVKSGNSCIWQCPAGFKMVGGNCVKDDQPEDCDPTVQQCDENGAPVCDPCSKLQQLINNNLTMINNDNRIISLTENIVTTMNTTNNNINNVNTSINNVNTNISNVNNNLTTINESIQNVITSIENNKPDFDTSSIVSKLDEVINAIRNNNGVGEDGQPIDLTEIIRLLNEIDTGVKDGKFDDTQLNAYFDEILEKGIPVGVNFEPVTERQDEQTSLLEDIKRLLMPTNEAGDPSLDLPEVEESSFDAWGAIKGFNINQNIINASSQCPADKSFTINLLVKSVTFAIPMTPMCSFLGYLAPVFLALAYFQGAMIILKAGD
ncbi:virulence factor TspB C-terminal domain-related protein [Psychrobacter faecalis]